MAVGGVGVHTAQRAEHTVHEAFHVGVVCVELDSEGSLGVVHGDGKHCSVGEASEDVDAVADRGDAVVGDGSPCTFEHSSWVSVG